MSPHTELGEQAVLGICRHRPELQKQIYTQILSSPAAHDEAQRSTGSAVERYGCPGGSFWGSVGFAMGESMGSAIRDLWSGP